MSAIPMRHRSNVSMSAPSRPESRASTTSATSHNDAAHDGRSAAAYTAHGPEAALLQYHASIDNGMPQHYAHQQHPGAHYQQHPSYATQDSPYLQDAQYMEHTRTASVPLVSDAPDEKRKKGSAVTATNDKELREMLAKNEGRELRDVAQEVIQKERTPMAEKTKQLFAMLWLRAVCKPAKTSVPRNRVYTQYGTRCGTERVVPLNPASFGKLVRVIFPGIQTRRLGVRGESKYHYVDLALEDESAASYSATGWSAGNAQTSDHHSRRSESVAAQQIDFNNLPRLQADTAAFPAVDDIFEHQSVLPPSPRGPPSQSRAFAWPDTRGMQRDAPEALSYQHTLRFPPSNMPQFSEREPVNLPSIHPYLPPRTDTDTAEALAALYRTHCTSLIDSIRFCKEKQFFRLYTSFHGTLTVPVQKLFTHPNLAPWIEQCDLIMYRTMVRFVSRLTLQAAPVVVINILSTISATLHGHIAKTFQSQPAHVLEAKLRPAAVFASLLHRLIRVNQSAHAAANLLTIDQNREQMWYEWVTKVNPKRVMEAELPNCGYGETYKILTSEMRSLLEPLQAPPYQDDPYNFQAYSFEENGAGFASYLQNQMSRPGSGPSNVSTETILDRWSAFISSLPSRFPKAQTRLLLHCVSAVGTAALRDITIGNGQSYGHWWVLKIFVDEMSLWLAEMGGFLEPDYAQATQTPTWAQHSPVMEHGLTNGHRAHDPALDSQHYPSFQQNKSFDDMQSRPQTADYHNHSQRYPVRPQQQSQHGFMSRQQQQQEAELDDSGIGGMGFGEEDGKYGHVEAGARDRGIASGN